MQRLRMIGGALAGCFFAYFVCFVVRFRSESSLGGVQRAHKGQAVRKTLARILGQSAGDDRPFRFGQAAQLGLFLQVLLGELAGVLAGERPLSREQLLVDDRQAVLVAASG